MDISGIKYLGIDRVLKRGTGEILADPGDALLVRDNVSGACLLACEDETAGAVLLDRYIRPDCPSERLMNRIFQCLLSIII